MVSSLRLTEVSIESSLVRPVCQGSLSGTGVGASCVSCRAKYVSEAGVPRFLIHDAAVEHGTGRLIESASTTGSSAYSAAESHFFGSSRNWETQQVSCCST